MAAFNNSNPQYDESFRPLDTSSESRSANTANANGADNANANGAALKDTIMNSRVGKDSITTITDLC